jgi:hypothetical protein
MRDNQRLNAIPAGPIRELHSRRSDSDYLPYTVIAEP